MGLKKNRYSEIKTKIIEVLVNDIHIGTDDVIGIAQKLLEHWQLELEHNSTIKDNTLKKILQKRNLYGQLLFIYLRLMEWILMIA